MCGGEGHARVLRAPEGRTKRCGEGSDDSPEGGECVTSDDCLYVSLFVCVLVITYRFFFF